MKHDVSYEHDYYGWILYSVHAIREGRFKEVDWVNVAEEPEDMAKSERRALRRQLARLVAHLLKWRYQPEVRRMSENSWRATIDSARNTIRELIEESPTFKPQLPDLFSSAYPSALAPAVAESNLPKKTFPAACPWSLEQVMDDNFWPER